MRILILTGKFGMGHWSASLSIRQQLLAEFPGTEVDVEDFFDYATPNVQAIYKAHSLLVSKGSAVYNALYRITENSKPNFLPVYARPLMDQIGPILAERQPDAVIATHPTCAQLLSHYKEETGSGIPLITCVTDVTAHSEWITDQCDSYLVPAPHVREVLIEKGVPANRILVTGIPVRQEFKLPPRRGNSKERRLLIMGGGLGLMPKSGTFYDELDRMPCVKTTIITGSNEKLYNRLAGRYENIEVLGFTDQVHDYMASSHLMLSKPGGITLFEAIFSQLPILALDPFLEQERHNADFLIRQGIGRITGKEPEECLMNIRSLIYDTTVLENMSRRMALLQEDLSEEGLCQLMDLLQTDRGVSV